MRGPRRLLRASILLLPALLSRQAAVAQLPLGIEFRVNSYTTHGQVLPAITSDSAGNFVVVWQSSGQNGPYEGIFGQRYDSSGAPLGTEFQVSSFTLDRPKFPATASDSAGNFVVVWQAAPGNDYGVFGQRYASSGARLGTEFQINSYTPDYQDRPAITSDPAGNFVVVWQSQGEDGFFFGVFGQRYAGSGAPLGTEFRVNSYTTFHQDYPAIASDSAGNFVVVWQSDGQDGSLFGVFGQRYASSGARLGAEFRVNSYTTNDQKYPSVASDSAGNFVVVWQSNNHDGSALGVFGQRYASSGTPIGSEFQVNSFTTLYQYGAAIASDPAGNFVVVWSSSAEDGSLYGVFGQRYAAAGARLGTEFQINSYTTRSQGTPAIASDPAGNFVVTWTSDLQDGSSIGVFGQRYCTRPLTAVSVSTSGSLSICPTSTGGTATVTDTGGVTNFHQWFYRTTPAGVPTAISGQMGASYLVSGADFAGGAPGLYYLFCLTFPSCGGTMLSPEIMITVSADGTPPSVTTPAPLTAAQTLCQ